MNLEKTLTIYTRSEEETLSLGRKLGQKLFFPSLIALMGDLGSGKTVFTRGIAAGIGIKDVVKSPSFLIVKEYSGPVPLYHFDLYRISSSEELDFLGWQEYFYSREGVVVIEWADKILDILPSSRLEIKIEIEDLLIRKLIFLPRGDKRYEKLAQSIKGEI